MATRSRIAVKQDKVWKSVYVHWDGYPKGVGEELIENYTQKKDIEDLIEVGHRSHLIDDKEGKSGYEDGYDKFETLQELMETFDSEDTQYLYSIDLSNTEKGWECFDKWGNTEINLYPNS